MAAVEQRFDAIDDHVTALVKLSDADAERNVRAATALEWSAMLLFGGLGLVGIASTLLMGAWLIRAQQDRADASVRQARMLEERNRDLDAFAGRVAHDLRAPLTTISLAASRVLRNADTHDRSARLLLRGVSQMERLIDALLSFSRVGAAIQKGSADTGEVIAEIEEEIAPRLEAIGVALRARIAPARVRCNAVLLKEILWNLVDNGAKYRRTDVRSFVEIRGALSGRSYVLEIEDNGRGMSAADVQQAFDPFFRGSDIVGVTGAGLGLSIVRRVVEANGGHVSVASQAGRGTTFSVVLPAE
jgi:signal transduction histidine kinase